MSEEDIKNYIDNQVRLSTDSSIKALTNLLNEVIKMFENHKKEIAIVVEEQIKKTVNGKIDKLTNMVNDLKPVKEKYDKEIKANEVHNEDSKKVLKWAAFLSAVGVIIASIKYFLLNLLK